MAIARANAALASRKVVLADADKVVTTWTSAFKRDPFEVPLDTKIAFLMKLNETALAVAGVSFVSSQVLFVDEQKYFASSEGSRITQRLVRTYPQFSTTAADRASGDFQTRAVVDRAQLVGYEYVEDYPWLRDAEKAGHEVVEKLKAKPVVRRPLRHRRRSVAAVPRHPRIGRPLDRARSRARLGSEHGGHQLPQGRPTPASCASARRSSTWSAIARSRAVSPRRASTTRA